MRKNLRWKTVAIAGAILAAVLLASPAQASTSHGWTHDCGSTQSGSIRVSLCLDLYTVTTDAGVEQMKVEAEYICQVVSSTGATYVECDGVTSSFYEAFTGLGSTTPQRPVCGLYGGASCDYPRTLSYSQDFFNHELCEGYWQAHMGPTTVQVSGYILRQPPFVGQRFDATSFPC